MVDIESFRYIVTGHQGDFAVAEITPRAHIPGRGSLNSRPVGPAE